MEFWYCVMCRVVLWVHTKPTHCPSYTCRGAEVANGGSRFNPVEPPIDEELEKELANIAWGGG